MKRLLIVALLAFGLGGSSLLASGCGGGGLWKAFYAASPTADQEEKMETVMASHREAMREQFKDRPRGEVAGFGRTAFDRAAFMAPHQERMKAMAEARTELFSQIHGILTPDQREVFVAKLAEAKGECGQKRQNCGENKRGGRECGEAKGDRGSCGEAKRGECDRSQRGRS